MPWIYLLIAGLFEVSFTTFLKLSDNFTRLPYTLLFALCATLSFLCLSKSIQDIPIGTAYAVWTGIGAAGTVIVGIWHFKEPYEFARLFFLSTLIASIIGIKFVSAKA